MSETNIGKLLREIQRWQTENMGNTCTICHGNNAETKCDACGWWGRVPPEKTPEVPA